MMKEEIKIDRWFCECCGYDGKLSALDGYLCCWNMDLEMLAEQEPNCGIALCNQAKR